MPNLFLKKNGEIVQKTHISRTHDDDGRYELIELPETETKMSLLGNVYLSNGRSFINFRLRQSSNSFKASVNEQRADRLPPHFEENSQKHIKIRASKKCPRE